MVRLLSVIPVKLEKKDIIALDLLVKMGLFKSRSEAIRAFVKEGINRMFIQRIITSDVDEIVNELLKEEMPFVIKSKKTVAEIVSEVRER